MAQISTKIAIESGSVFGETQHDWLQNSISGHCRLIDFVCVDDLGTRVGRRILAVVIGLAVAGAIIFGNEFLSGKFFPPPPGINWDNTASVNAFIAQLPTSALLVVLFGWVLATFVGSWIALRISEDRDPLPARTVWLLVLAGAIFDTASFTHPIWFWIAALTLIPASAYSVIHINQRK